MHYEALVQSPTPLLQLPLSYFLRGSPGLSTSAPRREQREVKRLPRRTPLAASTHTLETDARFQHRSSTAFAGARIFPYLSSSPAVILVTHPGPEIRGLKLLTPMPPIRGLCFLTPARHNAPPPACRRDRGPAL
ncbi:hypothetical protein NDU88_004364 [Pleurodeles waltl]|uniref:Uncharacterized protein n=1 Tax=Pleurodeles waltl TaxID=8319 RepID=A0AAV7WXJ2_PLEWA|nr:hypothetical protein NDU88_004364 [Pleurodeles waltl]